MIVDQVLVDGPVPERLWGTVAPHARALAVFQGSGELRESDDSSTCERFASAEYEFGTAGDFACRARGVTVTGRWWRRPAGPTVEFEATGSEGETLDGFVTDEGDHWRLDALLTTTAHRRSVVSVLRDGLGTAVAEGCSGRSPAERSRLDPDLAAQLASVDEFLEDVSRQFGLTECVPIRPQVPASMGRCSGCGVSE